jgi:hypothetical protein
MKSSAMPYKFELIASIPWQAEGMRERILPLVTGIVSHEEPRLVRLLPSLSRAPDGTIWLLTADGTAGRLRNGKWSPFSLAAADAGEIVDIGPLAENGVVVLGEKQTQQNVLARLDSTGAQVWRRVGPIDHARADVASLRGEYNCLRGDFDGSVYLPGTRLGGAISRIDLSSGATPVTVDLGEYRGPVWVQGGVLFRVVSAENRRWWVSRAMDSGDERRSFVEDALQVALAVPRSPIPSGGALLSSGSDLIWMSAQGKSETIVPLAGIVRAGDELAVGLRDGAEIRVTFWQEGKETDGFAMHPTGSLPTLISANHEQAVVRESGTGDQPERLTVFHRTGGRAPLGNVSAAEVLRGEGTVSTLKVLVEPAGSLLIAGADSKGVYLVRVRNDRQH